MRPRRVAGGAPAAALIAAWLASCAGVPEAALEMVEGVAATARVDRAEISYGDDLTLTLEVRSDPGQEVEVPRAASFEGFRTLDQGTLRDEDAAPRLERHWYRLRAERSGTLTLRSLTVRHRDRPAASSSAGPARREASPEDGDWRTVATEPITVTVLSRLPAAALEPPSIRDIKPLQPIERRGPWPWMVAAAAALALSAVALALWRRRRRETPPVPAVPAIPPHQIALAALGRLAQSVPASDAEVRRFYFSVSEIVRTYVEGRFGLNATDLTTEEILAGLDPIGLPETSDAGLRSFLRDSDRVKFAAYRPERPEVGAILERARRFVEETRPAAAETTPAAVAEEAA